MALVNSSFNPVFNLISNEELLIKTIVTWAFTYAAVVLVLACFIWLSKEGVLNLPINEVKAFALVVYGFIASVGLSLVCVVVYGLYRRYL